MLVSTSLFWPLKFSPLLNCVGYNVSPLIPSNSAGPEGDILSGFYCKVKVSWCTLSDCTFKIIRKGAQVSKNGRKNLNVDQKNHFMIRKGKKKKDFFYIKSDMSFSINVNQYYSRALQIATAFTTMRFVCLSFAFATTTTTESCKQRPTKDECLMQKQLKRKGQSVFFFVLQLAIRPSVLSFYTFGLWRLNSCFRKGHNNLTRNFFNHIDRYR